MNNFENNVFFHFRKEFNLTIDKLKSSDEEVLMRGDLKNSEDVALFLDDLRNVTHTEWVTYNCVQSPKRFDYHKVWICQHSSRYKRSEKSLRNFGCLAKLDIKIKKFTYRTKQNDVFLQTDPPLPCIIKLSLSHSHETNTASSLRMLRVDKEVQMRFFQYFNLGMGATESHAYHEGLLKENATPDILVNSSKNPTLRQVNHFFSIWRDEALSFNDPIGKITEKMSFYAEKGAPAIAIDSVDWAPSLNLGHDFFDGKRKLRKRKDKNSQNCQCPCDAYNGHKKYRRRKINSSKKNIIIDNKNSSTNMAFVRVESIKSIPLILSSETTKSSSETTMLLSEATMSSSETTMSSSKTTMSSFKTTMPSSKTTMSSPEPKTSHTSKFSEMQTFLVKSRYCRFSGCNSTSVCKGIHFYRFPKDEKRCKAWVEACKNKKLIGVSASELYNRAYLCSNHFEDWCFVNATSKHRLVHNAIPCCSKLHAIKITASKKVSDSTVPTITNDTDSNSSILKQLLQLESPISSEVSNTTSENSSSDSQDLHLVRIESGNSTILRYYPPEDAHISTSQSEDTSPTTISDSRSDIEETSLVPSKSGNSTILGHFPPEDTHIGGIQSRDASAKIVSPGKITSADLFKNYPSAPITSEVLLRNVKSDDSFMEVSNLENTQQNNLPGNLAELVQSTHTNSLPEPSNFSESEPVNCVTHAEAFSSAKTLLHYLMNQNDVDNLDINFILNLTKKIEGKLNIKKEITSENS